MAGGQVLPYTVGLSSVDLERSDTAWRSGGQRAGLRPNCMIGEIRMKPDRTTGGGCLCGNIRYSIDGNVGEANYCHCADCRRANGSAFNVGVRVEKSTFSIDGRALSAFTTTGESGGEITRYFCKNCGSPVFTSSSRNDNVIHVKAGSFDDPGVVVAGYQIWTVSEVPWARVSSEIPSFCRNRSE